MNWMILFIISGFVVGVLMSDISFKTKSLAADIANIIVKIAGLVILLLSLYSLYTEIEVISPVWVRICTGFGVIFFAYLCIKFFEKMFPQQEK